MVLIDQQRVVNAWAGRMINGFNILGFFMASIKVKMGNWTQFQILALCVSVAMLAVTLWCCYYIKEEPTSSIAGQISEEGLLPSSAEQSLQEEPKVELSASVMYQSWCDMDKQIKLVCWVEFFAWLGYFPLLFYTTQYVGELYINEVTNKGSNVPQWVVDEGTRRGSMALLANGIMSFVTVCLGPHLVTDRLNIVHVWQFSHAIFILGSWSTLIIKGSWQAVVLFGLLGIPWGCATWVPFVLINERLNGKASGLILGIHNVFVCLPQMLSSLLSSLVFWFVNGDDNMKWCFSILGTFAIGALWLTFEIEPN